jgi:hypothetical protein
VLCLPYNWICVAPRFSYDEGRFPFLWISSRTIKETRTLIVKRRARRRKARGIHPRFLKNYRTLGLLETGRRRRYLKGSGPLVMGYRDPAEAQDYPSE